MLSASLNKIKHYYNIISIHQLLFRQTYSLNKILNSTEHTADLFKNKYLVKSLGKHVSELGVVFLVIDVAGGKHLALDLISEGEFVTHKLLHLPIDAPTPIVLSNTTCTGYHCSTVVNERDD